MNTPKPALSVVIPAFNEEKYLPTYLPTVMASLTRWERMAGQHGEVVVVDNASTDQTAQIATDLGARVVSEPLRGIGQRHRDSAQLRRTALTSPALDSLITIIGLIDRRNVR